MRIAVALPGLHRVNRGAETAFEALGEALAERGHDVTLFGTGLPRDDTRYRFIGSSSVARERFERWPHFPPVRDSFRYEELSWVPGLLRRFRPADFDVTVTCSFPFTNVALRVPRPKRPAHVYVTENGDWPAFSSRREYGWFSCDGLVCTNATYHERNSQRWMSSLIPNGVDLDRFFPGDGDRAAFGIPEHAPVVLMVSALNPNKRVADGIRAVASLDDVVLVVAGDGPLRTTIDELGDRLLGPRYLRMTVASDRMPALYRCADAVLHTTLSESFGNVYVEALASGRPVVAHRSAHTQWIFGDSEHLVDTTSDTEITRAVQRALASGPTASPDDQLRRFTWTVVAEEYERFLHDVVENRKAS